MFSTMTATRVAMVSLFPFLLMVSVHSQTGNTDREGCPWEQCGKTVHLNTTEEFENFKGKNLQNGYIVYLYTSGCSYCDDAKSDYVQASQYLGRSFPLLAILCDRKAGAFEACQTLETQTKSDGMYPGYYLFKPGHDPVPFGETLNERSSGHLITTAEDILAKSGGTDEIPNFKKMRIKQLRKWLNQRGLKCSGCTEKQEFVDLAQEHASEQPKLKKFDMTFSQEKKQEEMEKQAAHFEFHKAMVTDVMEMEYGLDAKQWSQIIADHVKENKLNEKTCTDASKLKKSAF